MAPPDPFDADLSALHSHVDNLGPWLAIWQARREPDAHARRCANDAIDAIDAALRALHSIRAELVGQIRQADDQSAARVDELLARTREGPPGERGGGRAASAPDRRPDATPPPPCSSEGSAIESVSRRGEERR